MSTKTYQQPQLPDVETEDFDTEEGTYAPPIPIQRKSRNAAPPTTPPPTRTANPDTEPERKRRRPLVSRPVRFILIGMFLVLALWIVINQFILPAWSWGQDQWHYGDSRITQLDANVGHGGISHFIATFAKGDIAIIEIPLNNPTAYHVYTLTGFIGASGTPVILLSVQDVNHDSKPDLLIQVEGSDFETILYNTGTGFSTNEGQP